MTTSINPHVALSLLDDTVARIQLVVNREGLSVGLTRREHATLQQAVEGIKQALSPAPKQPPVPPIG